MGMLSGASGLLGGGKGGMSDREKAMYFGMINDEKAQADKDDKAFQELKAKQKVERRQYKERGMGQQGGGRQGLMFGRSQQGVA